MDIALTNSLVELNATVNFYQKEKIQFPPKSLCKTSILKTISFPLSLIICLYLLKVLNEGIFLDKLAQKKKE